MALTLSYKEKEFVLIF